MFLDPNTMQYYDSGAINIKTIEYYKVQYLIDLCCRTLQAFFPDELPPHCVELLDLTPGLICPFCASAPCGLLDILTRAIFWCNPELGSNLVRPWVKSSNYSKQLRVLSN